MKIFVCLLTLFASITALGTTVSTPVFGTYKIDCPADSDTYIGIPVTRTPEFSGTVESVIEGEFKVVPNGEPNWAGDKFVFSDTQTNRYYLKFTSGELEGAWYDIKGNDAYSLQIEIGESEIKKIGLGDSFQIIPHWTLATLFPDGGSLSKNMADGKGFTNVYKYTGFSNGTITYHTGKNNPAMATYSYRVSENSWRRGRNDASDEIIEPNTFLVIRQPAEYSVSVNLDGQVPMCATSIVASNLSTESDTDNYISIPSATDIKLSELTEALVGSELFTPQVVDMLYVYDSSVIGKNRPATNTYFYRYTNAEKTEGHWYQGRTIKDDVVLPVCGTAMVLRKQVTGNIAGFRSKFKSNYIK